MTTSPSPFVTDRSGADGLSRRGFLGLGLAALALAACDSTPSGSGASGSPAEISDVRSLLESSPFYVAHRGSYDNWPEHTMEAYAQSVMAGAKAIEVSVNATADGVLVCHHDKATERWSDTTVTIADVDFVDLEKLPVDAREWLGPSAEPQPIPRLTDVLDKFLSSTVIFLEDKQGTNAEALLDLLDTYPGARERIVWKQWAGAGQYRLAQDRGYLRWGYFTAAILDQLDELAPRFDYLGVPVEATDDQVRTMVAVGKPVIAWEVHTRAARDRLVALGVVGMMCSNIPYVTTSTGLASRDAFSTGLRAAGDLPWTTSKGVAWQPTFDVLAGALTVKHEGIQSYSMGSMCPLPANAVNFSFELRWPDGLPSAGQHAGVAFALADDRSYRVRVASEIPGYHLIIRTSGSLELFVRPAGDADGVRLAAVPTAKPEPGQWMHFTVNVSPDRIRVVRDGLDSWQFEVDDARCRGGYFSLCKNYSSGVPVQFRSVSVG